MISVLETHSTLLTIFSQAVSSLQAIGRIYMNGFVRDELISALGHFLVAV